MSVYHLIPPERPATPSLRQQLIASRDMMDVAELLRLAAISLRDSAAKLDRQADEIDPPQFDSLGAIPNGEVR